MIDFRVELLTARERRRAGLIAAALASLAVVTAVYLRPPAPVPSAVPGPPAAGVAAWDFLTPSRGWVLLDDPRAVQNRVFSTTDSGATWKAAGRLPDGAVSEFRFYDRRSGVAEVLEDGASGRPHTVRTVDGGFSWVRLPASEGVPPPVLDTSPRSVFFDSHAGVEEVSQLGMPRTLSLTQDGGRHWRSIRLPSPG